MRRISFVVLMLFAAVAAAGQGVEIDTATPEGQLLQQIGTEEDAQKKVALLEQFVEKYSDHGGVKWVLGQLPPAYMKLEQPEKSLAWCEKMLEKDPANAAGAHSCLKTAEARKDAELVRKWALLTHGAAARATGAAKPADADEDEWKQSVDFARQVGQYAEWSMYNAALQAADPVQQASLFEALKTANPKSEHLPVLAARAFLAYRQAGAVDKAIALAEQAMADGQANEDMLLVTADYYMNQKQDAAKTIEYSTKLIRYLEQAPPPQGVSGEDWEKKKKLSTAMGHWFLGVTYSNQKKYADADQALRQALPGIGDNAQLKAGALFHLGVANYQMGDKSGNQKLILEAFQFTKQCAAIPGPYQAHAQKNLKAMQAQYRIK